MTGAIFAKPREYVLPKCSLFVLYDCRWHMIMQIYPSKINMPIQSMAYCNLGKTCKNQALK